MFFYHCQHSDLRRSTNIAVIMQMFQLNLFLKFTAKCVLCNSQICCYLFGCDSTKTTHTRARAHTHAHTVSLSLSLSFFLSPLSHGLYYSFRLYCTSKEYGWGFRFLEFVCIHLIRLLGLTRHIVCASAGHMCVHAASGERHCSTRPQFSSSAIFCVCHRHAANWMVVKYTYIQKRTNYFCHRPVCSVVS
jgi:hypothetical protein